MKIITTMLTLIEFLKEHPDKKEYFMNLYNKYPVKSLKEELLKCVDSKANCHYCDKQYNTKVCIFKNRDLYYKFHSQYQKELYELYELYEKLNIIN